MAVDATTGVTDLVHALHTRIARGPASLGGPVVGGAVNGIADLVYGSVKGVTRAVGIGLDALLRQLAPLIGALSDDTSSDPPSRSREALLAALNGVLGDYLEQTHNPLAIDMRLSAPWPAADADTRGLAPDVSIRRAGGWSSCCMGCA